MDVLGNRHTSTLYYYKLHRYCFYQKRMLIIFNESFCFTFVFMSYMQHNLRSCHEHSIPDILNWNAISYLRCLFVCLFICLFVNAPQQTCHEHNTPVMFSAEVQSAPCFLFTACLCTLAACQDGRYGVNCTQECGTCQTDAVCNKTNGHCPCPVGKQPPLCNTGKLQLARSEYFVSF